MSTLIIYCSYREKGNTSLLIKFIKSIDKNCSAINLKNYNIECYNYKNNYNSTDFLFLIDKMLKYENIIFVSPVYWYAVSAELKVFIDRFSDLLTFHKPTGERLKGKNIYLLTQGFFSKKDPEVASFLRKTCDYMGMNFKKYEHIGIKNEGILKSTMKEKIQKFLSRLSSA